MKPHATNFRQMLGNPVYVTLAVVVVSALFRVSHSVEMADTPLPLHHEWRETDMAFFDDWAESVAAGDWLTRDGLHPYHSWHELLAARHHARTNPDEPFDHVVGQQIWDDWYGANRFHQEPFYSYLYGLLKMMGGHSGWMFLLQSLLGIASNVLIFLIARRFFGHTAAILAGGLAVLYGPFLFYEMVLLRTTLITFTCLLSLWFSAKALEKENWKSFLVAGLSLGIAFLVKSTVLLFLLCLLVITLRHLRLSRKALPRVLSLLGGFLVPVLPAILRNIMVGVSPLEMSSVATITFINANAADFQAGTGFYLSIHAIPIMEHSEGSLWKAMLETIGTHDSLFGWAGQLFRKFLNFWVPNEIPNNINQHYYGKFSSILTYGQLGFAWVGLPAAAGLILAARKFKGNILLFACLACSLVSIVAFYNLSRFRTPLVALLIPFAGYAAVELIRLVRKKRFVWPGIALVMLLALGPSVMNARPEDHHNIRPVDYAVGTNLWLGMAREAQNAGNPGEALDMMTRALEAEPGVFRDMTPDSLPERSGRNLAIARSLGRTYLACGGLAAELGRRPVADFFYARTGLLDAFIQGDL